MALRDPVAVYNAANNVEANLVRVALIKSGVEAFVTEALPFAGVWLFGMLSEIDKPQVWVEHTDIERTKPVLEEYERNAHEHGDDASDEAATGPPIEATCEECGKSTSFPPAQRGSVQLCAHCRAYMDVGGDDVAEDWAQSREDQERDEEP